MMHNFSFTGTSGQTQLFCINHERRFPAFCRSRCFRILPLRGLAQTKKKAGLAILLLDTDLARERKRKSQLEGATIPTFISRSVSWCEVPLVYTEDQPGKSQTTEEAKRAAHPSAIQHESY